MINFIRIIFANNKKFVSVYAERGNVNDRMPGVLGGVERGGGAGQKVRKPVCLYFYVCVCLWKHPAIIMRGYVYLMNCFPFRAYKLWARSGQDPPPTDTAHPLRPLAP